MHFVSMSREKVWKILDEIQRYWHPIKKKPKPVISFLTINEMEILLQQPDRNKDSGKEIWFFLLLCMILEQGFRN